MQNRRKVTNAVPNLARHLGAWVLVAFGGGLSTLAVAQTPQGVVNSVAAGANALSPNPSTLLQTAAIDTAVSDTGLLLSTPVDAAKVRLDLIRGAKKEILLSSYLFYDDSVGRKALAELREARRRGVRVVVVFDGMNNAATPMSRGFSKSMLAYMQQEGVEIYDYNTPTLSGLLRVGSRSHDKLLIVDKSSLVTGDRNIGRDYFGLGETPFHSRDVYVNGNSAETAHDYFIRSLSSPMVKKVQTDEALTSEIADAGRSLDRYARKKDSRFLQALSDWRADVKPIAGAQFVAPSVGTFDAPAANIERELVASMKAAKTSIIIENPYIILTDSMKDELKAAADRGVKIVVYTNSKKANDTLLVAAAWEDSRTFLTDIGAEVWEHPGAKPVTFSELFSQWGKKFRGEYRPEEEGIKLRQVLRKYFITPRGSSGTSSTMLHTKSMVVDNATSYVMSFNLDPRSAKINSEVAQKIVDPAFSSELANQIHEDQGRQKYVLVGAHGAPVGSPPRCNIIYRALAKTFKSQL